MSQIEERSSILPIVCCPCTQTCSMPYLTRDNIYLIPDSYSPVDHDFDYCLITSPLTSFLTIEAENKNRGDRYGRKIKVFAHSISHSAV